MVKRQGTYMPRSSINLHACIKRRVWAYTHEKSNQDNMHKPKPYDTVVFVVFFFFFSDPEILD